MLVVLIDAWLLLVLQEKKSQIPYPDEILVPWGGGGVSDLYK